MLKMEIKSFPVVTQIKIIIYHITRTQFPTLDNRQEQISHAHKSLGANFSRSQTTQTQIPKLTNCPEPTSHAHKPPRVNSQVNKSPRANFPRLQTAQSQFSKAPKN